MKLLSKTNNMQQENSTLEHIRSYYNYTGSVDIKLELLRNNEDHTYHAKYYSYHGRWVEISKWIGCFDMLLEECRRDLNILKLKLSSY